MGLNRQSNVRRKGVALIIVLAFVVLLLGVSVAYLSRTTDDRQVSGNSLQRSKVDEVATSAMNLIIGDLRQEIIDGSTAASISPTPAAGPAVTYVPKQSSYMLPL